MIVVVFFLFSVAARVWKVKMKELLACYLTTQPNSPLQSGRVLTSPVVPSVCLCFKRCHSPLTAMAIYSTNLELLKTFARKKLFSLPVHSQCLWIYDRVIPFRLDLIGQFRASIHCQSCGYDDPFQHIVSDGPFSVTQSLS